MLYKNKDNNLRENWSNNSKKGNNNNRKEK